MSPYSIETDELSCCFGNFYAVRDLKLQVPEGSFYGFLGPNGAGKSTTIKLLTGLLRPTSGQVRLLGLDIWEQPIAVKRQIGVVPEKLNLFDRLTGWEQLCFSGSMYGIAPATVRERAAELLELMNLSDKKDTLVADYSHGMKKKLALAAALLHNPRILFLDEPFEGVDVVAAKILRDLLQSLLSRKVTIFLTSHILDIVEKLCTDLGIIHHGQLLTSGTMETMMNKLTRAEGRPGTASLEEVFIHIIGQDTSAQKGLSWIH